MISHTTRPRAVRAALAGAVLLIACVALPARAQSGPDLLLKPWDQQERVEATVNGMFVENGHTKQEDADFRLSIYETQGRFRLVPGELASPRVGYEFSYFALHPSTTRLPDQLVNQSVAVAMPVGTYEKWIFGLSLGAGYAGEAPFGDGDAWFGRGTFVAFRELDKGSALAF